LKVPSACLFHPSSDGSITLPRSVRYTESFPSRQATFFLFPESRDF
jgi:hypothetical protein